MAPRLAISSDGTFEVEGHAYLIPSEFSAREVYSYRRLIEPIRTSPGAPASIRNNAGGSALTFSDGPLPVSSPACR